MYLFTAQTLIDECTFMGFHICSDEQYTQGTYGTLFDVKSKYLRPTAETM
jgi:hypothetical protein